MKVWVVVEDADEVQVDSVLLDPHEAAERAKALLGERECVGEVVVRTEVAGGRPVTVWSFSDDWGYYVRVEEHEVRGL